MPWTVRLQDERGKPIIPEGVVIDFATIPDDVVFRLLGYVDHTVTPTSTEFK